MNLTSRESCSPAAGANASPCVMQGVGFSLAFEGDGDGSGNDGTRIPHDDELQYVAFQRRSRKHLFWVCEGVSHVKI